MQSKTNVVDSLQLNFSNLNQLWIPFILQTNDMNHSVTEWVYPCTFASKWLNWAQLNWLRNEQIISGSDSVQFVHPKDLFFWMKHLWTTLHCIEIYINYMQFNDYFVSARKKDMGQRALWRGKQREDIGLGFVEQLNCWAWVSNLAWTPGSAYCLVEAAGEIFGLESKIWLLLGCAFQPASISLESPFQLVEIERAPRASQASINSLKCPCMQRGRCLN